MKIGHADEVGEFAARIHIAMEFVDGGNPLDWLRSERSDRREILRMFEASRGSRATPCRRGWCRRTPILDRSCRGDGPRSAARGARAVRRAPARQEVPQARTVADAELADRLGDEDVLDPLAGLVREPDRDLYIGHRLEVHLDEQVTLAGAGIPAHRPARSASVAILLGARDIRAVYTRQPESPPLLLSGAYAGQSSSSGRAATQP